MWAGRHVVLGVSGGIACYKSCTLARRLTEAGARVDVVLTASAAAFVGPVTFEALTGRPVLSSLWERDRALAHIRLGQGADLIILAPATANIIARAAQGMADDLLTTILVAHTAPVLLAPAMNDEMFASPATQDNLDRLIQRGWAMVGPETGPLAEGPSQRPGRMSEPDTILAYAARVLRRGGPLDGRRVVVTAGPTREPIDPVRVITNRSSGLMGYRLAEAAWERGARVLLISGPTGLMPPVGVELTRVDTTLAMEGVVTQAMGTADVLIMAAAPADYRPADPPDRKRPRGDGPLTLTLEPTADILAATRAHRRPGSVAVGFALETGDAVPKGKAKLERKDLDLIVINDALEPGAGFEVDTNRVTIMDRAGAALALPIGSKRVVADAVLDAVERLLV